MEKYTVTYDDGKVRHEFELSKPLRPVQVGDVYELAIDSLSTILPATYRRGDTFEIVERSENASHFRKSSLGSLIVKCKIRTSAWTEFDNHVAMGSFRLVRWLGLNHDVK